MLYDMSKQEDFQKAMSLLAMAGENGSMIEMKVKRGTRTLRQNNSLWLMFTQLADELNSQGLDQKKVLKEEVAIPWQSDSIREFLWKPVQKAVVGTESTTELTTKQIDEVFVVLQRHLHEAVGISISFPSLETLLLEQRG